MPNDQHLDVLHQLAEEHGLDPDSMVRIPLQFLTPARQKARVKPTPRRSTMRIEIVQNGRVLTQYNHQGRSYVEAPPRGEYTIRLTNTSRRTAFKTGRQLAVVSVDGLNIITGEKAGFDSPGYVVLPGQSIEIPGWRRSDTEVAAFQFKPQESSYTAQMGNGTSNTGVIGVAVYNEKRLSDTQLLPERLTTRRRRRVVEEEWEETDSLNDRINARALEKGLDSSGRPTGLGALRRPTSGVTETTTSLINDDGPWGVPISANSAGVAAAAGAASEESLGTTYGAKLDSMDLRREIMNFDGDDDGRTPFRSRARRRTPELGTGYGGRQALYTTETTFHRDTEVPVEVITLQYAVREKLIEWGVPVREIPRPSAFPASHQSVPAPPGWRG
jgi:hypothetical protein